MTWKGETLPVLDESEHWVVIAKPSGIAVHRGKENQGDRHFVLQVLRDQLRAHLWPVHRLDRPTSGCLVLAKSSEWAGRLHAGLRSPDARKRYLAFVRGAMPAGAVATVETPMTDSFGALREARSEVRCLASSPQPRSSLLLVEPKTGRFHQVRRHVRDLSHPVLGDHVHGDTRVNRVWREEWGLQRLGLHCLSLELAVPDGPRIAATCPIPDDLGGIWSQMPWWSDAVAALPELALPAPLYPPRRRKEVA